MSKRTESGLKYNVLILFENYDLNIHDLIKILKYHFDLNVWPSQIEANNFEDYIKNVKTLEINYFDEAEAAIQESQVVLYFFDTDASKKSIQLVEKWYSMGIPIILLKIRNTYIDSSTNSKFIHTFEMNKYTTFTNGYDVHLWLNPLFEELIEKIGLILKKPIVVCEFLIYT